jgi:hypothetical protein
MSRMSLPGPILSIMIMAFVIGAPQAQQRAQEYALPHLSYPSRQYYQQHPEEFQQLLKRLPLVSHEIVPGNRLGPGAIPAPNTWTSLTNPLVNGQAVNLSNPVLLTHGTVIAHDGSAHVGSGCTANWYKFTPDPASTLVNLTASYINGTWKQIGSLPTGYGPRFFGSGVLPDGRVIIMGGEYNSTGAGCTHSNVALGAIYDPIADNWTNVNPPTGWMHIGDGGGIVLPNGTYLQTSCCDPPTVLRAALLNPSTLTWTLTGSNKFDSYDEESMALLPDDTVLTVDAYVGTGTCGNGSERYVPGTGTWSSAGTIYIGIADCSSHGRSDSPTFEVGPLVMRPNGTAVAFGGQTGGSDPVAIYYMSSLTWGKTGGQLISFIPSIGGIPYTMADAPAAVLPNGNILIAASPGNWTSNMDFPKPTAYWEMNIADDTFTRVADKADAASFNSFQANFLVLPTGQVMAFTVDGPTVQIYTPSAGFQPSWQPVVSSVPNCVTPGGTYVASGTQFNGLTEGAYYGDDTNASTNFPLVRIVNNGTGHMSYARTFNHSSRSIAPNAATTTSFSVDAATETGASMLYVVANGIPSLGTAVTVGSSCVALQVTPITEIVASGPQGGPFSPTSFNYQLSATSGSLNFAISGIPPWLNANFTSGTVTATPVTVTLSLSDVGSLAPGGYSADIAFTNTDTGTGNTGRTATLAINGPLTPSLASGAAPLAVTFQTGWRKATQTHLRSTSVTG